MLTKSSILKHIAEYDGWSEFPYDNAPRAFHCGVVPFYGIKHLVHITVKSTIEVKHNVVPFASLSFASESFDIIMSPVERFEIEQRSPIVAILIDIDHFSDTLVHTVFCATLGQLSPKFEAVVRSSHLLIAQRTIHLELVLFVRRQTIVSERIMLIIRFTNIHHTVVFPIDVGQNGFVGLSINV